MKKNQNGVTLIALAVTIIVMLILAGVTMATLTGENGIITQARRTAAANTEGTVKEKMTSAYNSVIFQINMDRAGNEALNAQTEKIQTYLDVIAESIGESDTLVNKNTVATEPTVDSVKTTLANSGKHYLTYIIGNKIYIDYYDTTFCLTAAANKGTKANGKNQYPMLRAYFTLTVNEVSPLSGPITSAL